MFNLQTSGLILTLNQDGSALIGYEDYDVEIFGGADYEVMYFLDKLNFELLIHYLKIEDKNKIEKHLIAKFGKNFESDKFESFCNENKVIFKKNTHIG